MILIGTTNLRRTRSRGQFHCLNCRSDQGVSVAIAATIFDGLFGPDGAHRGRSRDRIVRWM